MYHKQVNFKLPSKTYLIAIPPYSKPDVKIVNLSEEIIKGVIPSLQPRAKLINDSTLIYEEIDFSEARIEKKKNSILEIIGYVWYREYYCAQVKINTHSFDINSNQLNNNQKCKIDY